MAIDISALTATQALTLVGTATGDNFQFPIANVGDINKDGRDDIVIGGYPYAAGTKESAYLIYGQASFSSVSIDFANFALNPTSAGITIRGAADSDGFGSVVSAAGDINGDGTDDFMIGAPRKHGFDGYAYIIYGKSGLANIDMTVSGIDTIGFQILADADGKQLGASLSKAENFNNDAYDDVVIGVPYWNNDKGAAIVLFGGSSLSDVTFQSSTATLDPSASGLTILGNAAGDNFGTTISHLGDINGDHIDDIIIGAPSKNSDQGAVYVIYGGSSLPSKIDLSTNLNPASTGFMITGNAAGDQFGCSVGSAGDINGDNIPDIIVGACGKDSSRGAAYIIYGRSTPKNIDLSDPTQALDPASTGFVVSGSAANDQLGYSVGSIADLNGDSKNEVIIGAIGQGESSNGAVYTVYSGAPSNIDLSDPSQALDPTKTGFTITTEVENGEFGFSVASGYFTGKTNGPDLFVGTSGSLNPVNAGYIIDPEICSQNYELVTPVRCRACDLGNGEYYDGAQYQCGDCLTDCLQCQDSSTCQSCSTGYGMRENDTKCIECNNVSGKLLTSAGECVDCINNCNVCSDLTTCDSCLTGFGKYDGKCEICPAMTYLKNGVCEPCIDDCDKCSDDKSCEYCSNGFGLFGSVCVNPCPEKMYISDDRICTGCISDCDQCSKEGTCDYCSFGFGLFDSVCVNSCPVKMRLTDERICKNCILDCDQCSDGSTCDYCSSGYGLLGSSCVASCPSKTYLSDDRVCEDCIPSCEQCTDNQSCNSCSSGYGILDSRCVKCPSGMYLSSNGECLACSPNCNQCSNSTSCQVCSDGYGVLHSKCASNPQEGLYLSNGTFLACSEGCSQCMDSSVCQVCAEDYMLSDWNTCVEKKEESENVKSSSAFEGASLVGAAFSSGGSLPFNFGLTSKMVRNVKYLNITVSSELRQSFVSWTATSSFLKAPESWGSDSDAAESGSRRLQEVFGRYGLERAFLINYWKTLILTLAGVVLFVIFKIIEICFTKENSKGRYILRSIHIAASNFALTQFYSNLDDVVLYLAFDARTFKFDTSFDGISFIIGGIAIIIGIIALSVHILLLRKYQGLKKKQAEFEVFKAKSQNVDLLFKDFKDTGFATQSFLLVYLIRCIVSSLIFALLFDYPFLQILMLLILNASMITYLLVVRPFKDFFDLCGQFFSEFILLLVNICMLILCIFDQGGLKPLEAIDKLSRCVIVLNVVLLVGCAVFLVISVLRLLYNLYKIYQEKKQTKNTSMALSSLNKKLDALKLTQQKTSGFEQSNESQQNLNNVTDHPRLSLEKANSNSMLFENQAEDILNTSHHGNLDLSGYFAERDLKLKYGAGVKPKKKQENLEEKLSNSGVLDHREAADIDPRENEIEKAIVPMQDFGASFKKKKTPKAENIQADLLNPDNEVANVGFSDPLSERDLQMKNENRTNTPEMKEIERGNEENLSNSGVLNHEEAADIDPMENEIEKDFTPLQGFGASFKKKMRKAPKAENIQENLLTPDNKAVNVEPSDSAVHKDSRPINESQIKSPEMKGELDEIGEKEEENFPTSVIFNHENNVSVDESSSSFPEGDLQLKRENSIKVSENDEIKGAKEEGNLSDFGIVNYDENADIDPNENQTENVIPLLQNFESTFKKKKTQKVENIKVQKMR